MSEPPTREVERDPLPERPRISVVLPVRNEQDYIEQTLERLMEQQYPAELVELLVCDGRSDDRTRELVERLARRDERVRLLDNPGMRSSAGRNVGFRAAGGDIVLVVDGHVRIPDNRLFANLADAFRRSDADALGRPQPLIADGDNRWSEAIAVARRSFLGHNPSSLIYDGSYEGVAPAASFGAAYRPHVFRRIGYVDESFDACEDLEFNTRLDQAGMTCYTSPGLTVQYFARSSLRGLFRQLYRYGFGRYKYLRRYPSTFSLSQVLPAAVVLNFAVLPLLPWVAGWPGVFGWLAALAAVPPTLYLAGVAVGSTVIAAKEGWRFLPRLLCIFPAIHVGTGVGFLSSILRGGRLIPTPSATAERT